MSVGSILIGLAIVVAIVPFVASPIVKRPRGAQPPPARRESENRLPRLLADLRDLDFDHRTGKVSDEDHDSLRADLLRAAADVIQAPDPSPTDAEDELEQAVRRLRRSKSTGVCAHCGNRLEQGDAFCSRCGHEAARICPHCHVPASPGDRYCTRCGTTLKMEG